MVDKLVGLGKVLTNFVRYQFSDKEKVPDAATKVGQRSSIAEAISGKLSVLASVRLARIFIVVLWTSPLFSFM